MVLWLLVGHLLSAASLAIVVLDLLLAEGAGIDRNMGKPTSPKVDVNQVGSSDLEPHTSDIGRFVVRQRSAMHTVHIEVGGVGAVEHNGHVEPPLSIGSPWGKEKG